MQTLPLATVKAQLSGLVDQVEGSHERVLITRNGKPAAVLVSPDDLAGIEETLEILSEPGALERIREAQRAAAAGDVVGASELRAAVAQRSTRAAG